MIKRILRILLSVIICGLVLFGGTFVSAKAPTTSALEKTADEILQTADAKTLLEGVGTSPTDWYLVAAGGMEKAPEGTREAYRNTIKSVYEDGGYKKITDAARVLIAYGMSGGDITDITEDGTINAARDWLYQNPNLLSSGINAMVFALQALDVGSIELPKNALHTRKDIIDAILALQLTPSGGFTLAGSVPDPDMTAMVITALAPYYSENKKVALAIERALMFLSKTQQENGGFKSFGVAGCESSAQVVVALTALGINPTTDARFIKSGGNPITAISEFKVSKGEYAHIAGGKHSGIATGQAFCAIAAYWRFLNGSSALYTPTNAKPPIYEPIEAQSNPTSSNTSSVQISSKSSVVTSKITENNLSASVNVSNISNSSSVLDVEQETNVALNGTESQEDNKVTSHSSLSIKHIIAIVLLVLAVIIAVIIFILAKKGYRILKQPCASLIMGAIAFALVGALLLTIRIQSVEDYYLDAESSSLDSIGSVTVEIECTKLLEKPEVVPKSLKSYIPDDGYILPKTNVTLEKGDTVFSVLKRVAKQKKIPLEYTTTGGAYVEGIGYLYEFSCGELSGWIYGVNSKQSELSASEYTLSNGDNIVWSYSLELGQDVFE